MAHVRRARSGKGWEARYRDPHGRERARSFRTKRDAQQFLARVESDVQRGDWVDPRLGRSRFDDWAEEWLATTVHLKPKTRQGYESVMNQYLLPAFGGMRIAAIEQVDVRRFVSQLVAAAVSPGRVAAIMTPLRRTFETAIGSGALKVSPTDKVKLPRGRSKEMHFLDPTEVNALVAATTEAYRLLVLFTAYTGLRAGEVHALTVKRVNLARAMVDVEDNLSDVGGKLYIQATKTYARRAVPLPAFLCERLAPVIEGRGPDEYLFPGPRGGPLRHNNFYGRHFKPAVVAAGLNPKVRFHDLRHTYASMLIARGAHPRAIMERLGHSSIQVTLDRYGHLLPSIEAHLTDELDAMFCEASDTDVEKGARDVTPPTYR